MPEGLRHLRWSRSAPRAGSSTGLRTKRRSRLSHPGRGTRRAALGTPQDPEPSSGITGPLARPCRPWHFAGRVLERKRFRHPFGKAGHPGETVCTASRTRRRRRRKVGLSRLAAPLCRTGPEGPCPRWRSDRGWRKVRTSAGWPALPDRAVDLGGSATDASVRAGSMVAKTVASSKVKEQSKCNFLCIKYRKFHKLFRRYPQTFPHFRIRCRFAQVQTPALFAWRAGRCSHRMALRHPVTQPPRARIPFQASRRVGRQDGGPRAHVVRRNRGDVDSLSAAV